MQAMLFHREHRNWWSYVVRLSSYERKQNPLSSIALLGNAHPSTFIINTFYLSVSLSNDCRHGAVLSTALICCRHAIVTISWTSIVSPHLSLVQLATWADVFVTTPCQNGFGTHMRVLLSKLIFFVGVAPLVVIIHVHVMYRIFCRGRRDPTGSPGIQVWWPKNSTSAGCWYLGRRNAVNSIFSIAYIVLCHASIQTIKYCFLACTYISFFCKISK